MKQKPVRNKRRKIAERSDEHFQVKWEYKKSSVWFGVQRA